MKFVLCAVLTVFASVAAIAQAPCKADAHRRINQCIVLVYRDPAMQALDIAAVKQQATDANNYEAQFELGVRLILGEGIKMDRKAGVKVLQGCSPSDARCAIAAGDLEPITYCSLEPKHLARAGMRMPSTPTISTLPASPMTISTPA